VVPTEYLDADEKTRKAGPAKPEPKPKAAKPTGKGRKRKR